MNSLNVAFPSAPVAWPPRSVDAEGTADRAGEWPNVPSPRSRADDVGAAPVAAESPSAYHALLGVADRVELEQGAVLYAPHAAMSYAFFPHSAVCSLLMPMMDGHEVEVGTVGYEGMLGLALFLGGQLVAHGQRRPDPRPCDACAGGRVPLDGGARCARWLCMTHDRVGDSRFPLTQEFLARMLGVRRAGVTVTAGRHDAGLIRYRRGGVRVLDRAGLEGLACECYQADRADYARRLAPSAP